MGTRLDRDKEIVLPLPRTPSPDEAETIARLNDTFDVILDTTAEDYGRAVRAVHAKGPGLFEATFTIDMAPSQLMRT